MISSTPSFSSATPRLSNKNRFRAPLRSVLLGCAFVALSYSSALADVRTWTGLGTDSLWSTAENWDAGAPVAGDSLVFAGNTNLSSVNDYGAGTAFADITFADSAESFAISGARISLGSTIDNQSTWAQHIALDIALTANSTLKSTDNSVEALTISGVISGAYSLTLAATSPTPVRRAASHFPERTLTLAPRS